MSVRYAILGLLAQRPRHGYELRAAFEAVVGGQESWDLKPAQVYSTLERLMQAGWIEEDCELEKNGQDKRNYRICEDGKQALEEWFYSPVTPEHQRDEFFVKMMIAQVSGVGDPGKVIQAQRGFIYRHMHAATTLRETYNPKFALAQILLLDKSLMHLEADLRWLDITEARLEEVKRQPLPEPEIRPRGRPRKRGGV
jgi:DNA-binding PadR family transcriptional regulator